MALRGEWGKFHPHHDHWCMIPFPHSLPKATQLKGFIFKTLFATSCHQSMFGKILWVHTGSNLHQLYAYFEECRDSFSPSLGLRNFPQIPLVENHPQIPLTSTGLPASQETRVMENLLIMGMTFSLQVKHQRTIFVAGLFLEMRCFLVFCSCSSCCRCSSSSSSSCFCSCCCGGGSVLVKKENLQIVGHTFLSLDRAKTYIVNGSPEPCNLHYIFHLSHLPLAALITYRWTSSYFTKLTIAPVQRPEMGVENPSFRNSYFSQICCWATTSL